MIFPIKDYNPLERIRFQTVTVALIAACVLAFLWQTAAANPEEVFLLYGLVPGLLTGSAELGPGEAEVAPLVTILTSMFLHGGFMHLAGNMLYLWIFGDNIEDALGHGRFLLFYLLCGTVAAMAQVAADPDSVVPMVGASGAISGVLGAYLVLHPRTKILVLIFFRMTARLSAGVVLGIWIAFQLLSGTMDQGTGGGVAWWAHIGGFLAGMALIVPMRQKGVPLFDRGGTPEDRSGVPGPTQTTPRTDNHRPRTPGRSRIPDSGG